MTENGVILSVLRIERNVEDLPAAVNFYCGALGFEYLHDDAAGQWHHAPWLEQVKVRTAKIKSGHQEIWLTQRDPPSRPYPPGSTAKDIWFQHFALVTDNIEEAYARLNSYDCNAISTHGPVTLPPLTGSVTAYKFRDPDGHPVEFIHFPKLEKEIGRGIDHTAISVSDTDRSIYFYCDLLGFKLDARQINQGKEQDDLDGLSGVKVDVVALKPTAISKPHIELLGYHGGMQKTPIPFEPYDIAADRIVLGVDNLGALLSRLENAGYKAQKSSNCTALLRDPDGHISILQGK